MSALYFKAAVICLFLLSPVTAWSQVLYGSIVGNVRDASGGAVPGATVTITNKETNQVRTTTTNDEGGYSLPTVQSGTYEVKAIKEGFRPMAETSIGVTINTIARVDFNMQVGSVSETIEVSSQAQTLQTDRAEVRAEITTKTLTDIPSPVNAIIRRSSSRFRVLRRPARRIRSARTRRAPCRGIRTE